MCYLNIRGVRYYLTKILNKRNQDFFLPLLHRQNSYCSIVMTRGFSGKGPLQETWDSGSIPGSGSFLGGGHGNPLRYSCLENCMDRGAWWVTVHGVKKSRTWLKWQSTHAHDHYQKNFTTCNLTTLSLAFPGHCFPHDGCPPVKINGKFFKQIPRKSV